MGDRLGGSPVVVSIHAPVRVRRKKAARKLFSKGFNPRTREGATLGGTQQVSIINVSIHAPVRVRLQKRGRGSG